MPIYRTPLPEINMIMFSTHGADLTKHTEEVMLANIKKLLVIKWNKMVSGVNQ